MAIKFYRNGQIARDTAIADERAVYLIIDGRGQGCDTIWFKDVASASRALDKHRPRTAYDLKGTNCKECRCHYSSHSPEYKRYSDHQCEETKLKYAQKFERPV